MAHGSKPLWAVIGAHAGSANAASCSTTAGTTTQPPGSVGPASITVLDGLVYKNSIDSTGRQIDLHLDILLPATAGEELRPTVVFVHGGSFAFGSRHEYRADATTGAEAGWVAASVDYTLQESEEAGKAPMAAVEAINDVSSALQWLIANSTEYGIDPQRIVAMGGSAGGFVVLSPWLGPAPEGFQADPLPELAAVVAKGATLEGARPIIGLAEQGPPALVINHETDAAAGTAGETIDDAQRTCSAITAIDGVCQVVELPGEGHLVSLAHDGPMATELTGFLSEHLGS